MAVLDKCCFAVGYNYIVGLWLPCSEVNVTAVVSGICVNALNSSAFKLVLLKHDTDEHQFLCRGLPKTVRCSQLLKPSKSALC